MMPKNQETLIVVFCVIVVALCYAFMPTDDFARMMVIGCLVFCIRFARDSKK